ncbi:MAG: beta-ketoacyl-[acyl-carrier-protein] synthase II [Opitutae bacterium]|jgi:3-oxoacyl-[acyl-carrier-protein] synthase II|nr:beta-ketoacyl-[acyl-carrier-protein] synthase II [Opitutae bacterium]|tara:strand:+ start:2855 stop:4090 length:1236 start_codon:yes stop_codon:yes gene_type:complete
MQVAVTGIGVITSVGIGVDPFWDSLVEGKSGIGPVTRFDADGYTSQVASEVNEFDSAEYMDPKEARRNDRYTQFAMGASRLAVDDSGIDLDSCDLSRVGVLVGSGIGGMETIERQVGTMLERGPRKVSPFMIPSLIANIAGGVIAIEYGARGPNFGVVSACATGTHAIGESLRIMTNGEADVMLAGGSEAAITRIGFAGFCSMKAMSTSFNDDPSRASRPFDKNRDGFVMGEGAGVLVLETMERALDRGARIYAELAGYAATCDAFHITSPDVEAVALTECMNGALRNASLKPSDVDYLNAHGTSTPYNDKSETQAIKNVFAEHAMDNLLVSSTKSMTGHLLGAAGAIEAAACCKALQTGIVPPTINYEEPDPECDLDYVPNQARNIPIEIAMSNNSGFGGHNASLIFRKA